MKEMRVLVACEFSGIGREAFRSKGHDAWSCDIIPSEGCPTHHIQGDVLEVLEDDWDLIIAHPPCTYLSNAGACRLYPTKGNIDEEQKRQIRRDEHGRPFSGPSCEHGIPYGTMWPCKICMQPKPTAPPEQGEEKAERGLVCCFCGKGFGYAGTKPDEAIPKAACDHEAVCPKNPYLAEITTLRSHLERKDNDLQIEVKAMNKACRELAEKDKQIEELHKSLLNKTSDFSGAVADTLRLKAKLDISEKDERIHREGHQAYVKIAGDLDVELQKAEKIIEAGKEMRKQIEGSSPYTIAFETLRSDYDNAKEAEKKKA